jgi:ferredoxin
MSTYQRLIVYYFSGTGNSHNVALWLSRVAQEMSMATEIITIADIDRRHIPPPENGAIVAFCSPVHGFNYPPVMLSFIRRFPKGTNPVLLMNTRAGMLIGRWITPGWSGATFLLSGLLLRMKGYRIRAMFPVDMPSNWLSVHPGLNRPTVEYLHLENKKRVMAFARTVLNGGCNFRALREIVQDVIITPVSLGYYVVGRFLFSKTYYASFDCNRCGVCIKECPVLAIKKVDERPFWTFRCESCMKCMSHCPKRAIETAHGSIVGFSFLFSLLFWTLFQRYFDTYIFDLRNTMVNWIVQTALLIFLLGVWYRGIHYLLRFRWFERIVVYTSLTKFKFWGRRYKALPEE